MWRFIRSRAKDMHLNAVEEEGRDFDFAVLQVPQHGMSHESKAARCNIRAHAHTPAMHLTVRSYGHALAGMQARS